MGAECVAGRYGSVGAWKGGWRTFPAGGPDSTGANRRPRFFLSFFDQILPGAGIRCGACSFLRTPGPPNNDPACRQAGSRRRTDGNQVDQTRVRPGLRRRASRPRAATQPVRGEYREVLLIRRDGLPPRQGRLHVAQGAEGMARQGHPIEPWDIEGFPRKPRRGAGRCRRPIRGLLGAPAGFPGLARSGCARPAGALGYLPAPLPGLAPNPSRAPTAYPVRLGLPRRPSRPRATTQPALSGRSCPAVRAAGVPWAAEQRDATT